MIYIMKELDVFIENSVPVRTFGDGTAGKRLLL